MYSGGPRITSTASSAAIRPFACGLIAIAAFSFSACGKGSSGGPPPPVTYTIGGTISGLSGTGLVLQNNGGNNLSVSATQTTFTFATPVNSGGAYSVTVSTQPSNPAQTCAVTNASGTASANVTNVQVACTTNPTHNVWIWMGGANVVNQAGTYGTEGTPAPGNIPGARDSAVSWTDTSGNFWLFGGATTGADINDLWEYSADEWTWVSGSNTAGQGGVYGTQGTANPSNIPGARDASVLSMDPSGNAWLFGGQGYGALSSGGELNDLWEYSAGEWTWVSGSDVTQQSGIYGTKGVPAPTNVPGARKRAIGWIDQSGNFWLFGGVAWDSKGKLAAINDLWEYSAGQWTWMSGSNTIAAAGVYGTMGTAAPSNVPGARSSGASWKDASGNLWLFGGGGLDSNGTLIGFLNDLWTYTLSSGEWTWIGGPDLVNQPASYGTQGTPAPSNIPGGRIQAASWTDASGNVWLFGGYGLDSTGATGQLSDLWKYSAGQWTWVSGSNLAAQAGNYGTQGIAVSSNIPGARQAPVLWLDSSGNVWFFGGYGYDSQGTRGELNDLWEYLP